MIKIYITGGTFDKEYNEIDGKLYFKNTHMYDLLSLGRCNINVDIETLMMIDSLKMTATDRNYIVDKCIQQPLQKIIITHGTDTMVKTAQLLEKNIKNKTIILTGAMIPFTFGSSDGLFNMGSAIAFAQSLENGVYISMNGHIFKPDNVYKNKNVGIFEPLKDKDASNQTI
tara:strand:- start:5612 stop:6124 length:513 start_codon:yes stop_codon:yes gene_type:complete